jgi:O-phospho-L-seryl-tRNASec:L-selenocysteinyl-tRNA synthase
VQVERVGGMYPGRACMSPLLDLLITLLHWGAAGWRQVLQQREELYGYARQRLGEFAAAQGERVLETPGNPISLALTLSSLEAPPAPVAGQQEQQQAGGGAAAASSGGQTPPPSGSGTSKPSSSSSSSSSGITFLGSMLFNRCVSGTRVVARGKRQEVGGLAFPGYGAHCDAFPCDYLTVAAALGTTQADIDELLARLGQCLSEFRQRRQREAAAQAAG